MILVYTTHPNQEVASKISNALIDEKLVACVNYFPIEACLVWNGVKTSEHEIVALFKTDESKWTELKRRFLSLHPYEVPCLIKISAEANESYENWIKKMVC